MSPSPVDLKTWLVGTFLAATVPLALLMSWQTAREFARQHRALDAALVGVADAGGRAIEQAVDRSIDHLQRLGSNAALRGDDLDAARELLQTSVAWLPEWRRLDLLAADGLPLLGADPPPARSGSAGVAGNPPATPDGSALGGGVEAASQPAFLAAVRADRVAVSAPFQAADGKRRVQIGAALGRVRGAPVLLVAAVDPQVWLSQVAVNGLSPDASVLLCDDADHPIAGTTGASATEGCRSAASAAGPYTASQTLARRGWRLVVALSAGPIDAAQRQAVLLAIGIAAACLLLGVAGAALLARWIAEPLERLAEPRPATPTEAIAVTEIARLRDALARADALQRASAERSAAKAQEFEALFQDAPLGLALAQDADCRSVVCNREMDRLMPGGAAGCHHDVSPDAPMRVLWAGRALPVAELPLRRAAISGLDAAPVELELHRPGAPPRFVLASAVPLLDSAGEPRGAIGAMVDLTERRQCEAERAEAIRGEREAQRAAAGARKAAERAKHDFVSMLGHELRNPLNAIATATEVLNRSEASSQVATSARGIIANQVRQLAWMLDALLDVGRMLADEVVLLRQPLDLAALVQRAAIRAEDGAGPKRQRIVQVLAPAWINADLQRLDQVVDQLLSNAIRHTPCDGRIGLTLALDAGDAVLRVGDCGMDLDSAAPPTLPVGPGLPEVDALARMGIGLTLMHRLVDLHGGSVTARSDPSGSGFTVRLPAIDAPA